MKLLFFIHSLGSGGAERVTANVANHWAGKGWAVTVVTLAPQADDFYELHPAVSRIGLGLAGDSRNVVGGFWQNLRRIGALRRVLRQIEPDVALRMMTTANVLLALAALVCLAFVPLARSVFIPRVSLGFTLGNAAPLRLRPSGCDNRPHPRERRLA